MPPRKPTNTSVSGPVPMVDRHHHGSIFTTPDRGKCLDTPQLNRLEQSFRDWSTAASRADVRMSRQRILLIFLLIRYTGAKLNEVLGLDLHRDIDFKKQRVIFGRLPDKTVHAERQVQLSASLCQEIRTALADRMETDASKKLLAIDPGFVRRKFYERAEACGIAKHMGAPEILRKSRAVELMRGNMPLPAVQMLLGHATPNLTSAYVSFSEGDIQQVTRMFMEREAARQTSARNAFFGKIESVQRGDILARIVLATMGGYSVSTVITNDSLQRLGLKAGQLMTAEVKAPWVMIEKTDRAPQSSADNRFAGVVDRINPGAIGTEYIVRLSDNTHVCSLVTRDSFRRLALAEGDAVWVLFSSFAVVLLSV